MKKFEKILFVNPRKQIFYGLYNQKLNGNISNIYKINSIENLDEPIVYDAQIENLIKNYNKALSKGIKTIENIIENKFDKLCESINIDNVLIKKMSEDNISLWIEEILDLLDENEKICSNKIFYRDIINSKKYDLEHNQIINLYICGYIDYNEKIKYGNFFINLDFLHNFRYNTDLNYYEDLYKKFLNNQLGTKDLIYTNFDDLEMLKETLKRMYIVKITNTLVIKNLKKSLSKYYEQDDILKFLKKILKIIHINYLSNNKNQNLISPHEMALENDSFVYDLNDFIIKRDRLESMCFENSLLFKLICDNFDVPCKLQLGYLRLDDISKHVWCKIIYNNDKYLVDPLNTILSKIDKNKLFETNWIRKGLY